MTLTWEAVSGVILTMSSLFGVIAWLFKTSLEASFLREFGNFERRVTADFVSTRQFTDYRKQVEDDNQNYRRQIDKEIGRVFGEFSGLEKYCHDSIHDTKSKLGAALLDCNTLDGKIVRLSDRVQGLHGRFDVFEADGRGRA